MEKDRKAQACDTYITQIRMPNELSERAKEYAAKTGASINAIVCIALDEFLRKGHLR